MNAVRAAMVVAISTGMLNSGLAAEPPEPVVLTGHVKPCRWCVGRRWEGCGDGQ